MHTVKKLFTNNISIPSYFYEVTSRNGTDRKGLSETVPSTSYLKIGLKILKILD